MVADHVVPGDPDQCDQGVVVFEQGQIVKENVAQSDTEFGIGSDQVFDNVMRDEIEFPLVHVDYKSRINREGRTANCTWYQSLKDLDPGDEAWDDVAKFNPIDAEKLGIKNGERIKLISKTGEIECTAKLWEGVRPGTVAKAYGQGHWAYGKVAAENFGTTPRGGNNNDIIPADYDRLSGSTAYYGTARVQVAKV